MRKPPFPFKTDPVLVIHAGTVLPFPRSGERFEPVARDRRQPALKIRTEPIVVIVPSPALSEYLQRLLDEARTAIDVGIRRPCAISSDGTAVLTHGSIGYCCYVSPDGKAFLEEEVWEDPDPDNVIMRVNTTKRGQIAAIVMSLPYHPILRELLPVRNSFSVSCSKCSGQGWITWPENQKVRWLCEACCGLGWKCDEFFED